MRYIVGEAAFVCFAFVFYPEVCKMDHERLANEDVVQKETKGVKAPRVEGGLRSAGAH
jgi:hypothetical protein